MCLTPPSPPFPVPSKTYIALHTQLLDFFQHCNFDTAWLKKLFSLKGFVCCYSDSSSSLKTSNTKEKSILTLMTKKIIIRVVQKMVAMKSSNSRSGCCWLV